jgi:hypothetical protein
MAPSIEIADPCLSEAQASIRVDMISKRTRHRASSDFGAILRLRAGALITKKLGKAHWFQIRNKKTGEGPGFFDAVRIRDLVLSFRGDA